MREQTSWPSLLLAFDKRSTKTCRLCHSGFQGHQKDHQATLTQHQYVYKMKVIATLSAVVVAAAATTITSVSNAQTFVRAQSRKVLGPKEQVLQNTTHIDHSKSVIQRNVQNKERTLGFFPSFGGAIRGLELVDTRNNERMGLLRNGQVIVVSSTSGMSTPSFNINAITAGGGIGSVVFGHGRNPRVRRETKAPWTLCGNRGPVFFTCPTLGVGTHTVTATPYASKRGVGRSGKALTVTFSIVQSLTPTRHPTKSPLSADAPTIPVAFSISPVVSSTIPAVSPASPVVVVPSGANAPATVTTTSPASPKSALTIVPAKLFVSLAPTLAPLVRIEKRGNVLIS
jgi:hypothetical protein